MDGGGLGYVVVGCCFFIFCCCVVVLLLLWLDLTPRGRLLIIIIMKTISKVPQKAL